MKITHHAPDYNFIITTGIIILFGLIMLSSASAVLGYDKFGDAYYFLKHQILVGLLPGLIFFFILSKINYQVWNKFSLHLLGVSILLLLLVFIPGIGSNYGTARSWVNIAGFSLQPAEIVKLTFLLYLAAWLAKRKERIHSTAFGLLPFLLFLGLIIILIILQPDIGTLSIIVAMSIGVYFLAGGKVWHIGSIVVAGLGGLFILIKAAPYRLARFTTFLNPSHDPHGLGYHINQAFLAIGSGGFFGVGLGRSRQKFEYLPEVAGDSIFAIIAEELGFFIMTLFIALLIYWSYRGFYIAKRAPDQFARLIIGGIVIWITTQVIVNIGAMLGILPLTGVPLPFVSHGGTALMTCMAAMGVIVNISKQTKLNNQ